MASNLETAETAYPRPDGGRCHPFAAAAYYVFFVAPGTCFTVAAACGFALWLWLK